MDADLFTCWPPGPLERENEVVPLGRLSMENVSRHVLASVSSSGSKSVS